MISVRVLFPPTAHRRPIYPTHLADLYHGYNYSLTMLTNFIDNWYMFAKM